MGSKNRIAKQILPIILKSRKKNQYYVEPFVGGANIIDKVNGLRIASDNNKYLIAMWRKLSEGWIPPRFISREFYSECRTKYNNNSAEQKEYHIIGYVGFNGSYGGRFYDGGYAGITITKLGKERNYPLEAYNNVINQIELIKDIKFEFCDYKDLKIPNNSVIYCDIPYARTKEYKSAKSFNHNTFWDWCRDMTKKGHNVFISEYNAPKDFVCLWEKEVRSSLRANSVISGDKKSIEKLFMLNHFMGNNRLK